MQYGFFDEENREYVIDQIDVPVSWTNYLGVEDTCAVVNQTAGGYLFYKSPEYHRMTRFRGNAVPADRPGFDIYLRDTETGDYWSATWQPVAKELLKAQYTCHHGLSYSRYFSVYQEISTEMRLSVPLGDPVLLWDITIKNTGERERSLQVFSFCEFSFHAVASDNQNFQMSLYCAGADYEDCVIQQYLFYEPGKEQYFTASFTPEGFDTVRDSFLGTNRTEKNPKAVEAGRCFASVEEGNNHCGALQKNLVLKPGEETRLIFMLGAGNRREGKRIRKKYSQLEKVDRAYIDLKTYWEEKLNKLQVQTPNQGMNVLLNTWTLYQAEINVMFSRFASFIEVGGRTGLGYRDAAQDAMTVPHSNPDKCRERILQLLRALTAQGYGIHLFQPAWFDPGAAPEYGDSPTVVPVSEQEKIHGIEQACSDDALWLVPSVTEYIKETGDFRFLEEMVTYADKGEGTVYEHMKRILDFSAAQVGENGICKGLRADWNDCLNLGGGESALVTFLHYWAIQNFLELAGYKAERGNAEAKKDVAVYTAMGEKVRRAGARLWDREWYIRGITKSGKRIGTMEDEEGKIHLESNAWAVLSKAADRERAKKAMDSVEKWLLTPYGLQLLAPAYTKREDEIGFVTRVCPGLKENGAVFSHPNPWAWAAECVLGRGDKAMELYNALCPYYQNDKIEIREAEPYSYCQFIMGPSHSAFGRARHSFMTGSGGWAYFAATRYMLGIRPGLLQLEIDPCIPAGWKGFTVWRTWRGAQYQIRVENPDGVMKGVTRLLLDGEEVKRIPPMMPGSSHKVLVVMGKKEEKKMLRFGTGGWRAIIGDGFTRENIQLLAKAVSDKMHTEGVAEEGIVLGYDRRFLSKEAMQWAAQVFAAEGIRAKLINKSAPTPLVMFYVMEHRLHYGMMITASHNPAIYNGVKVFTYGGRDADQHQTGDIETYLQKLEEAPRDMDYGQAKEAGLIEEIYPFNEYLDAIISAVDLEAIKKSRLRIALDPMYGVSETSLKTILMTARCEVFTIHERHDTLFGGKLPAPNAKTLGALQLSVLENHCDIGLATDGDADRIGVIDDEGNFLHSNDILVLLYYYLVRYKGWEGPVVRNLCTTHLLDREAEKFGESCYEVPVGFKYISAKMQEVNAVIGGESSGGLTVRGHIHGKDGIYAAALLVEMIAVTGKKLSQLYREIQEEFGEVFTEERSYSFSKEKKEAIQKLLLEEKQLPSLPYAIDKVSYLDGCKVYFRDGGWISARFSGTEPLLRIFCEKEKRKDAKSICEIFEAFLGLKG